MRTRCTGALLRRATLSRVVSSTRLRLWSRAVQPVLTSARASDWARNGGSPACLSGRKLRPSWGTYPRARSCSNRRVSSVLQVTIGLARHLPRPLGWSDRDGGEGDGRRNGFAVKPASEGTSAKVPVRRSNRQRRASARAHIGRSDSAYSMEPSDHCSLTLGGSSVRWHSEHQEER